MRITPLLGLATAAALTSCTTIYLDFSTYVSVGTGGNGGFTGSAGGHGGAQVCTPGAKRGCYSGAPATEGIGICKAGEQVCAPDGTSWGPCEGEVLPQPMDDCATPIDEDCDGMAPACMGNLLWAKRFGNGGEQLATAMAADAMGNVLVTGHFTGEIDFGGGPLTSAGTLPGPTDVFVAKLDAAGHPLWSKRFGDTASQQGRALGVSPTGDVIVVGDFAGSIDFGGGSLTAAGVSSVFITRLDEHGNHLWSEQIDGPSVTAAGAAFDAAGNVFVAGSFLGAIDVCGSTLDGAGDLDIFVVKLDGSGACLWAKRFGATGDQEARGIAADATGGVLLAGRFQEELDLGNGAMQSAGGFDGFVGRLSPDGSPSWATRFGDAADQEARALAIADSSHVIVAGTFAGAMDLGGKLLMSAGGGDVFLAKLGASDGAHVWSTRFGDTNEQDAASVAVDATGSVVMTGTLHGQTDFGGGPLASIGGFEAFLAKFRADAAHQWSKRFGDAQDQFGQAVAADATGNVLLAGNFQGTIDLGGGPLVSEGGYDVVIAKFAP